MIDEEAAAGGDTKGGGSLPSAMAGGGGGRTVGSIGGGSSVGSGSRGSGSRRLTGRASVGFALAPLEETSLRNLQIEVVSRFFVFCFSSMVLAKVLSTATRTFFVGGGASSYGYGQAAVLRGCDSDSSTASLGEVRSLESAQSLLACVIRKLEGVRK